MKKLPLKILKEFGLTIGIIFPLLIGFLFPLLFDYSLRLWTLPLGLVFILLSILKPKLLYYPYKTWMKFGNVLGGINSKIIFGLVFLFILVPISYIMRLFGHDPLKKKFNENSSYREYKNNHKTDFNKIF